MAVSHALAVLGWLEMKTEDQPPEEIWLDTEALTAHFAALTEKYQPSTTEAVPDGDSPSLQQNELTRDLRR